MTNIIGAKTLRDALSELEKLIQSGEERGERITVFCEDKLTLLAERAAVSHARGTFLTEVTTFARFLKGEGPILSKQGSVMAVSSILSEYASSLKCFKKSAAQAVYETIAQLLSSRADAEMLKMSAEETEGMLSGKLSDLSFVLGKYEEFLKERGLFDENGYLALLPEKIGETARGRHIVFFAFPSFTRQAMEGVRAALLNGGQVTGIFLAGEGGAYTNEAIDAFTHAARELGPVQTVTAESSLEGDAAFLAAGLFSPEVYGKEKETREHIHLFRASDEGDELERVCALIKMHAAEGLRYRDFAVLLSDRDRFLPAERMFSDYGIPFFSDRKRPFSEHPFCRFALDILSCVHDGGQPDSVDAVLSSVYFGHADDYRNYLLKFGGFRGAVNREIKDGDALKGYDRASLTEKRDKLRACLALFPREGKGKKFVEGIKSLYELVGGDKVTDTLAEKFEGAEREFLDVTPLTAILDETEALAGEERFTAREFMNVFESGLSALEIAMIPQSADAVFLGDATESKFDTVPVLFCLGADESLPRTSNDTAVITDSEIKRLKTLSVEIEPQIDVVNRRAKESLYLNLCSFGQELYVGCPLRIKGEEARRGEAYLHIERMVKESSLPRYGVSMCCERGPAFRTLLRLRQQIADGRGDRESKISEEFCSLKRMLEEKEGEETVSRLLYGGKKERGEHLKDLLFRGQISPSLLESYFSCPYRSFAEHGLKIREREERSALYTDTGSFVHAVLEQVAPQFNDLESEEACKTLAERTARDLLSSPRYAFLTDTGAGAYTGERLVKECGAVTAACYRQLRFSSFRVLSTEEEISLPAIGLKGRTDRIDVSDGYVRIIDYKTGDIDDRAGAYYTGRKLQLELYLLAASEGKTPAGAFYFPAQETFTAEGEEPFRMKGFFVKDDEVLSRMDALRTEGKSTFFEGGGRSEKGLPQEDFNDFLNYALLVSGKAIGEMTEGNLAPSPYDGACDYCKFKGMCGFSGETRKESSVSCAQIAAVVKAERGEE